MSGDVAPAVPVARCSTAARHRGDPVLATAPPARRLLLIEVRGPWGRAGLTDSRLDPLVTRPLVVAANAAGVRVQLIRRPGRRAGPRRPGRATPSAVPGRQAWALASPDDGVIRWGRWLDERELLDVDLTERLDPRLHAGSGPQRLALVCTHARHDVCCALRGRPVVQAVAAGTDRLAWETSHVGGDRFAANLLALPEGELFGGLDEASAIDVVRRLELGRLTLGHYRGRIGRPPLVQAAVHLTARERDDDRLGAVRVRSVHALGGDRWEVLMEHDGEPFRLLIAGSWQQTELLTCAALAAAPVRRFELLAFRAVSGPGPTA